MNLISTSCQYVVFCVVFWRTKCRYEFPTQMLEILWPWVKIDCDNVVKTVTPEEQGQLCFSTTRPRDWVARAQWRICWSRWGRSLVWMLTTRFQLQCRDNGELWRPSPTFELVRRLGQMWRTSTILNPGAPLIFSRITSCPIAPLSSGILFNLFNIVYWHMDRVNSVLTPTLTKAGSYCWSTFVLGHQRGWRSSLHVQFNKIQSWWTIVVRWTPSRNWRKTHRTEVVDCAEWFLLTEIDNLIIAGGPPVLLQCRTTNRANMSLKIRFRVVQQSR